MRTYLRYYATEAEKSPSKILYHATAEYSSGLSVASRFAQLEITADRLLKEISQDGKSMPKSLLNGPTKQDIQQHGYRGEIARPLTSSEEKRFLKQLGL
jgi:hypothetical protein